MVYPNKDLRKMNPSRLAKILSLTNFMLVLSLVVLGLLFFPLFKSYSREKVADQEIRDVEKQIKESGEKNQALKDMLGYLDSSQATEDKARLNLNYKKSGEKVLIIQEQSGLALAEDYGTAPAAKLSNPQKWFHHFFD